MAPKNVSREWFDKDYYQVLGVAKNASAADIKKAYRKLAQKLHPDANSKDAAATERFKEVSAAYAVLADPERRKEYDEVRDMAAAGAFRGGFGGAGGSPFGFSRNVRVEDLGDLGDLGDLFGGLFGEGGVGGRRRRGAERGSDLQTQITVSFEDAMSGTTVPVRVDGPAPCSTCGGSGARPGTSATTCAQCGGSGTVTVDQGVFSMARTCPRCEGRGRTIEDPCSSCRGTGSVSKTRSFRVKVPPGVREGARIRLAGRGEAAPAGGEAGDLYVVVRVRPHPVFGRRGSDDLTLSLPLTFPEAALGANIPVPTLNGPVKLKVPPGTPHGKTFRVRGKGAPKRGGERGDLLVTVSVEVPSRLSRKEREILEQFRQAGGESPRKHLEEVIERG